ncbi:LOW QUALITY PROTEIN: embryo-specific protein ATS3B [Raphanus sativus]|uniref:LOW QUALITY PROTEIN: embryo-specific protein ATS3B n=1 Tax=Raphanus sativus TaxID=3726 RepID=A0A6J0P673_RAPSA|nr:LOW QUALITY PROTEIN: embryo-specific protein ATS3B [Raphanus sativus]
MSTTRLFTLLCFFFLFSTLLAVSESKLLEPQAAESFNVSLIQKFGASCSYTVIISTSCSSSRYTRDQISVAFGDAYGNQIYAPRLDDPSIKTFEQCSSDTFEINGPCTYQICYVYLYRSGPDGWIPESVKIYSHGSRAVTFPYNTNVPESIWYGFNYCNSASGSNVLPIGLRRLCLILLGFILAGSTLLL